MAFVARVRKDALDHAIWTVFVVSHPVVTDHIHWNWFQLGSSDRDRGRDRSRDAFSALALPLRGPAGGGAGSNLGGSPGESGGPGGKHQDH